MVVASPNKADFKRRVNQWAEKLDIEVTSIAIRPMKNKWASCSTNGRLNFDPSLIELCPELQDYVIVHELLHFRVPNHGKVWKALMMAYLGDYQQQEAALYKLVSQSQS